MNDQLVLRLEPIVLNQPLNAYAAVIHVEPFVIDSKKVNYRFTLKSPIKQVNILQLRQLMPAESIYAMEKHIFSNSSQHVVHMEYDVDLLERQIDETIFWFGNPCVFGCFVGEHGLTWGYVLSVNSEIETHRYLKTIHEDCEADPILLDVRPAESLAHAQARFEELLDFLNRGLD